MCRVLSGLVIVAVALCNPAMSVAAVTFYSNESSFLASNPIVSTVTFDEYPCPYSFQSPVVTIDSINFEALPDPQNGEEPWWCAGIHFGVPGYISSPNDFGSNLITDNIISFDSEQYLDGIGFWLLSGSIRSGLVWEILVEETDGSVEVVNVSDWTNDQRYYGFSSPLGIKSITVRDYAGDSKRSNWSFDNVSCTQVIPEPATLVLLVMGVLSLIAHRHKR